MYSESGLNPESPHQHSVQAHGLAARNVPQAVIAEQRRRRIGVVRGLQSQLDCLEPPSRTTLKLPAIATC